MKTVIHKKKSTLSLPFYFSLNGQETTVELPTIQTDLVQDPQTDPRLEQYQQETVLTNAGAMATNNMLGKETSESDNDSDTIPQLHGRVEAKSIDLPPENTHVEKEDKPVILKMLDDGFAETKTFAPGFHPLAIVFRPELGIVKNSVQKHLNLVVFKWKCIK